MQRATNILEQITADRNLMVQLRQGDLHALEKLNLSLDEMYASAHKEDDLDTACAVSCSPSLSVGF